MNVFPVTLPPLRERGGEDIPILADYFLKLHRGRKAVFAFTPKALRCLRAYPFPGNVRELDNEVQRARAVADDGQPIGIEHLSERFRDTTSATVSPTTLNEAIDSSNDG